MDKTYEKTTDGRLKEIDTKPVEITYSLKTLKAEKQFLTDRKTQIQAQIDAIQLLINKCKDLGVPEDIIPV